jgi:CRISPR-associated endonuclease/helicase Cas3
MWMQPAKWPHQLDHVWAKSRADGETDGESLAQHTWFVLERLADLQRLRPDLPQLVDRPQLWHDLFWICLLHDLGKAANGFQAMLRGGERFGERHEVLSLLFVDWIARGLSEQEQCWIVTGIVSHHRDQSYLSERYSSLAQPDPLTTLVADLPPDAISGIWHWLDECATNWIATLGLDKAGVRPLPLLPHHQAVGNACTQGVRPLRKRLNRYLRDVEETLPTAEDRVVTLLVLLRGLTTSADHMASAHLKGMTPPIHESWQSLAARILKSGQSPYFHQVKSAVQAGRSTILIAPTGSGKTEAALYWALGDGSAPVPRLFYTLPYQASMNAMFDRLKRDDKGFGKDAVGVQHGRAVQAMYARLMDEETGARSAEKRAKWQDNINKLNARPIKVFSPYQMLKAAFQLRGFEAMLTDYAQAAFIFDEIHAYEPKRLALILALVKYLRERYGARFFVMSATFPKLIQNRLREALGPFEPIQADQKVFDVFRRHELKLLDGELLPDGIERIVRDVRDGKRVLACANTVRRAQDLRAALIKAGLTEQQVVLLHSRYIIKDRTEREEEIMQRCEVGKNSEPFVLVATQVVEVSLNIDLDTIYSDPAPLEALLQRFGRVNRAREKGICPVYVFRRPTDGQRVYGRHTDIDKRGWIVQATLAELEQHDDMVIDEAEVNTWLDRIYADPILNEQWTAEYEAQYTNAILLLRGLRPFNSDPLKEEQFEEMFDNVDVLPECFEQAYLDALAAEDFIEASRYFIGISQQKFVQLKRKNLVRPADSKLKQRTWVALLPYDELGLSFEITKGEPDYD